MNQSTEYSAYFLSTTEQFSSQIQQFWKIEKPMTINHFTVDDIKCEEHHLKNNTRYKHGK